MKYLIPLLTLSLLFSQELEVEGDLKVTGTVESATIDSMQAVIDSLKAEMASMHADNQLETRVYELNDISIDQAWNCANETEISAITGQNLDYGIITLLDLNLNSSNNNNFQPVVQIYHVDYPINNLSEMSSGYFYNNENVLINSVTARVAFKSSEDILCVVGVNTQGSGYPVTANIKIAITAQFPD